MLDIADQDDTLKLNEDHPVSFTLIETKRMPASDWYKFPDCPYQRNTELRAERAKHLRQFAESHRKVVIAKIRGTNEAYKVDGHTRALMWQKNMTAGLPHPLWVSADVYRCESRDEHSLGALYEHIDNKAAVQTSIDITHGAARNLGLQFKSKMLQADRYSSAIKYAYGMVTRGMRDSRTASYTHDAMRFFSSELKLLDRTSPKQPDYPPAIFIAALLTFRMDGEDALSFWKNYGENVGKQEGHAVDGVVALRNLLSYMKQKGICGSRYHEENVGRIINAYEAYGENRDYVSKHGRPRNKKDTQLNRYLQGVRK